MRNQNEIGTKLLLCKKGKRELAGHTVIGTLRLWLRSEKQAGDKNQKGQAKAGERNRSEEEPGSDGDSETKTPLAKSLG